MEPGATVSVICGFIGAGKTTFAKQLEERTGAVRITKDEWLIAMIGNDPTIEGYQDFDHRMCGLSRDIAFRLAEKGIDVIIDEGVWERTQRDILRRRAEEVGARTVLYYVDTPIATIRERVEHRNADPGNDSFRISSDLLDSYLVFWDPPSEDEAYVLTSDVAWDAIRAQPDAGEP